MTNKGRWRLVSSRKLNDTCRHSCAEQSEGIRLATVVVERVPSLNTGKARRGMGNHRADFVQFKRIGINDEVTIMLTSAARNQAKELAWLRQRYFFKC